MYDRLWCRVYFLHHGGGLSVPKYIMWKLKHQRSVNHYLIINKARVLNRFVNQCIAIVNFQTPNWRSWYNFMHLFISENLENIWYIHQVSFAWKTSDFNFTPSTHGLPTDQGRNEVYFFVADPVFLRKFLIPDPKSDENFDPWSHKI